VTETLHTFVYGLHEGDHDFWYVGMTVDVDRRFAQHRTGNPHFTPDTQLHILDEVTGTPAECAEVERLWIEGLRSVGYPLVNTKRAWPWQPGRPHTDDVKRRISEATRGNTRGAANRGRVVSEEHKRNLSTALQGRVSPRKGVVVSEETRQKLRQANVGKKLSDAHRAAISTGLKARKAATA
jgi:hypothetical protein